MVVYIFHASFIIIIQVISTEKHKLNPSSLGLCTGSTSTIVWIPISRSKSVAKKTSMEKHHIEQLCEGQDYDKRLQNSQPPTSPMTNWYLLTRQPIYKNNVWNISERGWISFLTKIGTFNWHVLSIGMFTTRYTNFYVHFYILNKGKKSNYTHYEGIN